MPLDTGHIETDAGVPATDVPLIRLAPAKVVLRPDGPLGAALREARESVGQAECDIAEATCVRTDFIAAIEAGDLAKLPARPFVIGYVRAYARALGLDAEAVVARFRAEAPVLDDRLASPMGVRVDRLGGMRGLLIAGAVVALAIGGWNVMRRLELRPAPRPSAVHAASAIVATPTGPSVIGAPLPAPPEAATPQAYETPGLRVIGAAPAPAQAAPAPAAPSAANPGAAFVAAGMIYGAPAPGAGVVLQSHKTTTLIVRGAGGAVYFARVLNAGEAWRASRLAGLTVDVADPAAVEVFVDGASHGPLPAAQTALAGLRASSPG